MSDGQVKLNTDGKVLITAAGKVKICQCCTTEETDEYREHLNCCNQCRSVYMHVDVEDHCSGTPGAGNIYKWRGKCYGIARGDVLTLAQAEATGRPVVVDSTEVECLGGDYASCAAAQTATVCPACSECCLRWYPSKACLVGDIPSNPQNSVCCNLGRQARFISTCTIIDSIARTGNFVSDASGCHYIEDPWVFDKNDAWSESNECRWRATCPVASPCIAMTLNTRVRAGTGAPLPLTGPADCSVIGSGACTNRAVSPSARSFCNATRPHTCLPFTCTGDFVSQSTPGTGGCSPTSLNCGSPGCAGCELDAYPCYSSEIRYSWSCYRSCRSGNWHTSTNTVRRPYEYLSVDDQGGWYCPGELCEAQIIGVCAERYNATLATVCEWEFIIEDEEGCLSDNVCFQYNGECLEATEGITTPDEICSDPECEPAEGEEMAPLMAPVFAPDEAGGGF